MACRGRGRSALIIVTLAALTGASLLAWDHWSGHHDSKGTVILWLAWFAALFAVFAAPSGGCCCRAKLSRLFRRGSVQPENPYRDVEQS